MVTDKGLSGEDTEDFLTDLDLLLIRPARKGTNASPGPSPTGCVNVSKRSSGPSRTSSASNTTAVVALAAGPGSCSAYSP